MEGRFCVISPTVDASGHRRTWHKDLAKAVAHGRRLINQNAERGNAKKTSRLFVVQVVRVLETPPLVTVTDRDPKVDEEEYGDIEVEDDG